MLRITAVDVVFAGGGSLESLASQPGQQFLLNLSSPHGTGHHRETHRNHTDIH